MSPVIFLSILSAHLLLAHTSKQTNNGCTHERTCNKKPIITLSIQHVTPSMSLSLAVCLSACLAHSSIDEQSVRPAVERAAFQTILMGLNGQTFVEAAYNVVFDMFDTER